MVVGAVPADECALIRRKAADKGAARLISDRAGYGAGKLAGSEKYVSRARAVFH